MIMQKLTSLRLGSLVSASLLKLGAILILLTGLMVDAARTQDSFATAEDLGSAEWGAVTDDNTGVVPDNGTPNIGGFAPNAPLWYKWTAPQDGVVTLDTIGSQGNIFFLSVDTVVSVFTGSSLTGLSQVAANDDLFPINGNFSTTSQSISTAQRTISGSGAYAGGFGIIGGGGGGEATLSYIQPFYGPSGLRFNAKGGQTYYFAVD